MKNSLKLTIITAALVMMLASCSEDNAVFVSQDDIIERIDMVIDGNDVEHFYLQSSDSEFNTDLVDFTRNTHSSQVEFILNLDNNRQLIFSVTDKVNAEPWTRVGQGYNLYAVQDLEDKLQWVTSEIRSTSGDVQSISDLEGYFPGGTYINVFHIVEFDPASNEVLCRIDALPMVKVANDENITVNGTFRGTISFLN